jgi:hypothetical protein
LLHFSPVANTVRKCGSSSSLATTVTSTFFGHPMELKEEILEQILADKFDVATFDKAH